MDYFEMIEDALVECKCIQTPFTLEVAGETKVVTAVGIICDDSDEDIAIVQYDDGTRDNLHCLEEAQWKEIYNNMV